MPLNTNKPVSDTLEISITGIASISPLGTTLESVWEAYGTEASCMVQKRYGAEMVWVAPLTADGRAETKAIGASNGMYGNLDDSVLFALYAGRKAVSQSGWSGNNDFGVNIGSSRGATALFEKYHAEFLKNGRTPTLTSPTTTLGNISSWIAHDLQTSGPEISHSITCSTALHALLNGVAWIRSGMADQFLVGGSEAPLTAFTIAQMKALKIYADSDMGKVNIPRTADNAYPCRALDLQKKRNTMVLGEGAAVACLEKGRSDNALAVITGVGYATEPLKHNISISTDALCFQRSMAMALGTADPSEVDVIVMHAPGTIKGDLSEFTAIEKVFCNKIPVLTTNKWKIGHTFGASGLLNIELAVLMLLHQKVIEVPFLEPISKPSQINKVMVNAVGFGGNAVSVLLSRK
ncbi:beta-ketoacyl synthase N-terminal-like domain-containing protein [Maribacter sp. 2-571]|uniref:beta-ketoacyl synthase N-terminal-like domain-containing protein n=1 Tax=Maribacter sp. 2-571 TaxID=3417569 RepID=UPI003D33C5D7